MFQNLKVNAEYFVIYLPHYSTPDTIINKTIMGNTVIRYIEFYLRSWWDSIKGSLASWVAIFFSFIGGVFLFGRYTMEAQKDRQITEINAEYNLNIINLEHQHQTELQNLKSEIKDKEKESEMWKEKYFQLLLDKGKDNIKP